MHDTTTEHLPAARERDRRVALALGSLAVVAAVLAITVLHWYRGYIGAQSTFGELRSHLGGGDYVSYGLAPTYFHWAGYLLLALAVAGAIACPVRPTRAVRVATAAAAVAGLAVTLWALDLYELRPDPRRYVEISYYPGPPPRGHFAWVRASGPGAWAMLFAFALCLAAALITRGNGNGPISGRGPRRSRRDRYPG